MKSLLQLILWEIVNPILLRLNQKKIYSINNNVKGINLGCGIDNPPNWIGIDGGITHLIIKIFPRFIAKLLFNSFSMSKYHDFSDYYKKIKKINLIHHDLTKSIPFPDNTINNIYSSHFFEHLTYNQSEILLKECFRVLKKGGIIRIAVPSLDQEVQEIKLALYAYENGDFHKIQKYVTSESSGYNSIFNNHRFMFNYQLIFKHLEKVGFCCISKFNLGEGNIPDVKLLDTRESLFVEAMKDEATNTKS